MLNLILASHLIFLVAQLGVSGAVLSGGYQYFYSRPDLVVPVLQVDVLKEGTTPGYIFVAPHHIQRSAATIYDTQGRLVWCGLPSLAGGDTHSFRKCSYKGSDHLCFYRGERLSSFFVGEVHIYSNEFVSEVTVKAANGRPAIDMHENNLVNNGASMLVSIYNVERYDLSKYGITTGEGWVQDGLFQKIDVATGELLFEWSGLDHIPLSEMSIELGATIGAGDGHGLDVDSGLDYLHLNSVDENADGDYLVSCRHTQTVYKVSGQDGRILWRLGGRMSDFEMQDGVAFGYQHHARWQTSNTTTEVITLFDNAFEGAHYTATHSRGKLIKLDYTTTPPRASLLAAFRGPEGIAQSTAQGSVQILHNNPSGAVDIATSNVFIGWGSSPYITEHLPSGEIVFQASLNISSANLYRVYKYNFTSNPRDTPSVFTYAQSTDSEVTAFYMSWNGATELTRWRVYGRQNCSASWTELGTIDKHDFETTYQAPGFWAYSMVEALDARGNALRRSAENGAVTFVPSPALKDSCDLLGCNVTREGHVVAAPREDTTRAGCPFLPKKLAPIGSWEQGVDEQPGGFSTRRMGLFAALLVSLVLSVVMLYRCVCVFPPLVSVGDMRKAKVRRRYGHRNRSALLPPSDSDSDPECEELVESERGDD